MDSLIQNYQNPHNPTIHDQARDGKECNPHDDFEEGCWSVRWEFLLLGLVTSAFLYEKDIFVPIYQLLLAPCRFFSAGTNEHGQLFNGIQLSR